MKRFEILEGVRQGCTLSVVAAAMSTTIALAAFQFNPSKEVQDACRRMVPTALVIITVGGIGAWWSDRIFLDMAHRMIERVEEARWQSLRRLTKGKGHSIASCRDCKHLVGHLGNNQVLICAMHPYGWQGKACPDKEEDCGIG